MQQHNSIFELNWEQDFPVDPILPSHASLIETDPLDSLVFTENILHRKNHHAWVALSNTLSRNWINSRTSFALSSTDVI